MSTSKWAVAAAIIAGGAAAAAVVRMMPRELPSTRWRVVTVSRPPDVAAPDGHPPAPFASFGEFIQVRVTEAPGGRGTELAARLRPGESGTVDAVARLVGQDPLQLVRKLLREAKQLAEVGEVLRLNPKPEGTRHATPGGALIDLASRRSGGEGVL